MASSFVTVMRAKSSLSRITRAFELLCLAGYLKSYSYVGNGVTYSTNSEMGGILFAHQRGRNGKGDHSSKERLLISDVDACVKLILVRKTEADHTFTKSHIEELGIKCNSKQSYPIVIRIPIILSTRFHARQVAHLNVSIDPAISTLKAAILSLTRVI